MNVQQRSKAVALNGLFCETILTHSATHWRSVASLRGQVRRRLLQFKADRTHAVHAVRHHRSRRLCWVTPHRIGAAPQGTGRHNQPAGPWPSLTNITTRSRRIRNRKRIQSRTDQVPLHRPYEEWSTTLLLRPIRLNSHGAWLIFVALKISPIKL